MADEIPDSVYEDAARAFYAGMGYKEDAVERMVEAYVERGHFRAVVESAYRAGQRAMLDYVSKNADVLSIRIPVTADRYHAALATIRDLGETKEPDRG